eukprot:Awhi_evm1s14794
MTTALTSHFKSGKAILPDVPKLHQLTDSIFVVLGMNPGPYTLNGTNTYIIGRGKQRLLIDCGESNNDCYLDNLQASFQLNGIEKINKIIISHWHQDHLGGLPGVLQRFESSIMKDVTVHKYMPNQDEKLEGTENSKGEGAISPYNFYPKEKFHPLQDNESIESPCGTVYLKVLHTPGHANDHVALLHEDRTTKVKSLFCFDNILGVGTSKFNNLHQYLHSLEKMKDVASEHRVKHMYSSHGPVIEDPVQKIQEYIDHRYVRINQISSLLRQHQEIEKGGQGENVNYHHRFLSVEEITRKIYGKDLPENLIIPATFNSLQVLLKLQKDGLLRMASAADIDDNNDRNNSNNNNNDNNNSDNSDNDICGGKDRNSVTGLKGKWVNGQTYWAWIGI